MLDKTLKLHVYTDAAHNEAAQGDHAEKKDISQELAKKDAQLEEEKNKSLEHLKTIVQLRENLKQEKAKTAELEARLNKLDEVEANQLAKKNAQLEEERKASLEYMRMIEQLRESLKQERAKKSETEDKSAELEAKKKELAALEAKMKDLSGALNKISSIAATGKLVGD